MSNLSPHFAGLHFVGDWLPLFVPRVEGGEAGAARIGNLECAIAGNRAEALKAYCVALKADSLNMVRDGGFAALSVANNHTYDAGSIAFNELVQRIRGSSCVQLYGLRGNPAASFQIGSSRCAVIGCLERCRSRGPRLVREEDVLSIVREIRRDYDRVIVTPHWGKEGEYAFHPSPAQRRLARRWVDAGVDGVFGHHSHTVQGSEVVKARPVYYSLGNFCFDHAEGRQYPLTSVSLAVSWRPGLGAEADHWSQQILLRQADSVRCLTGEAEHTIKRWQERITVDMGQGLGARAYLSWARNVGAIYMQKSRQSWRLRFTQGPLLRVFPLWLAWNVLPCTLLLRLGEMIASKRVWIEATQTQERLASLRVAR